jgi:hypothetical protein
MKPMKSKLQVFIAACALIISTGAYATNPHTVNIGRVALALPYPETFKDLCSVDKRAREIFSVSVPPTNQMIGCFVTVKDFEEYFQRAGGVYSSYLIASVMSSTKSAMVSTAEFGKYKRDLKNNLHILIKKYQPDISRQLQKAEGMVSDSIGLDTEIQIGEMCPLGVYQEEPNLISTVWLTKATVTVGKKKVNSTQVQTSSVMLIRGSVFIFFGYREYKNKEDIEKLKQTASQWMAQLKVANRL